MQTPISIVSIGSFSPLGNTPEEVWESYLDMSSCIKDLNVNGNIVPAAALPAAKLEMAELLKKESHRYAALDNSVLYAMIASRNAIKQTNWNDGDVFGINIGSSRGATDLFEKHYHEFLATGKTAVQASPATTLGNISTWVAQDLKSKGPEISHSITCSTALHAVLNGVAWLRAGMADKFLVGGSEAPLTAFTISQMQAMKIYSSLSGKYPCRALDLEKTANTMVLGEGAASACFEKGYNANALAYIEGIGYATETLEHSVSISNDAQCLYRSMRMALADTAIEDVDAVVMHAPGTIKGDISEYAAIKNIFGENLPLLTTNKWKTGHTFGASGLLSLEFAVLMLMHQTFINTPFSHTPYIQKKNLKKILINAVGFGGNAVSILVTL